jgi:predicted phage terminase large subunit-like protein
LNGLYPHLTLHVTVDLAGMEPNAKGADNDYTVINLSGFGKAGQIFVLELFRGRFRPDEVINTLFDLHKRHPRIIDFKIEKDAHMRVLGHFLRREMQRRGAWLPIVEIQRDNRTSKVQRIKGLQPWLKNGTIRFASDLVCKQAVLDEVMRFPKYAHDDILDTVADHLQNREGGVEADVMGRVSNAPPQIGANPIYKFVGFNEQGGEQWLNNQFGSLSRESDNRNETDPFTGF